MNLKSRGKENELKEILKNLLVQFDADQIFNNLVACSEMTTDIEYLNAEIITYLQIYQSANVVKTNSLTQQMEFEAHMEKFFPYYNDQQTNLFLQL